MRIMHEICMQNSEWSNGISHKYTYVTTNSYYVYVRIQVKHMW